MVRRRGSTSRLQQSTSAAAAVINSPPSDITDDSDIRTFSYNGAGFSIGTRSVDDIEVGYDMEDIRTNPSDTPDINTVPSGEDAPFGTNQAGNIMYTDDFDLDSTNSKNDGERGGVVVVPVNFSTSNRLTGAMDPKINETRTMEDAYSLEGEELVMTPDQIEEARLQRRRSFVCMIWLLLAAGVVLIIVISTASICGLQQNCGSNRSKSNIKSLEDDGNETSDILTRTPVVAPISADVAVESESDAESAYPTAAPSISTKYPVSFGEMTLSPVKNDDGDKNDGDGDAPSDENESDESTEDPDDVGTRTPVVAPISADVAVESESDAESVYPTAAPSISTKYPVSFSEMTLSPVKNDDGDKNDGDSDAPSDENESDESTEDPDDVGTDIENNGDSSGNGDDNLGAESDDSMEETTESPIRVETVMEDDDQFNTDGEGSGSNTEDDFNFGDDNLGAASDDSMDEPTESPIRVETVMEDDDQFNTDGEGSGSNTEDDFNFGDDNLGAASDDSMDEPTESPIRVETVMEDDDQFNTEDDATGSGQNGDNHGEDKKVTVTVRKNPNGGTTTTTTTTTFITVRRPSNQ